MRLTTRSEYALLALAYLGRNPDRRISVAEIAKAQEIPVKFLEQILLTLRQHRVLQSSKGRTGGYELLKAPSEITLAEVVRLFDGALAPTDTVSTFFHRVTPIAREKKIVDVFQRVRDQVAEIMEGVTLADVL